MSHAERGDEAARMATGAEVAAFLRALARRADTDPAFAEQLRAALAESGLAAATGAAATGASARSRRAARNAASATPTATSAADAPPDPFSVYRAQGEDRLRAVLDGLDLAALRAIVRAHRLDPARISARWTTRERVIGLIVDQVKARANHGRAFERV